MPAPFKLYGTLTSPFVRRVRVVAEELGVAYRLLDTNGSDEQNQMRALNPLWKVPTAELGGQTLCDSHLIVEYLLQEHGYKNLRPLPSTSEARWRELNLLYVIDGALDAAINTFYFRREGVEISSIPYLIKQTARVEAAMRFIEQAIDGVYLQPEPRVGLAEIHLMTAIEWMLFREAYPVLEHPRLERFREAHRAHPSFAMTSPVQS